MSDREKIQIAAQWTVEHCNGVDNMGLCPICEGIMVCSDRLTANGRLIGSCGDAFTIKQWEADD
jgi:hypothetical protein